MESVDFEAALAALPEGNSEGISEGPRYGVSFRRSDYGRRNSLFARELAGTDIVSFNLNRLISFNLPLGIGQRISQTMRDVCGESDRLRLGVSIERVKRSSAPKQMSHERMITISILAAPARNIIPSPVRRITVIAEMSSGRHHSSDAEASSA